MYLLNRLPTKAVKGKTPFEAWFGFKLSVSHVRVFGCINYAHVLVVKRSKLERRSLPSIFVGYSSTKKGYMIFDLFTNKILVSRDVKFNEVHENGMLLKLNYLNKVNKKQTYSLLKLRFEKMKDLMTYLLKALGLLLKCVKDVT